MINPFERVSADPSLRFYTSFSKLSDDSVLKVYSQTQSNPDVRGVSGFDSVVRLNSTYLEVVDRGYNWRGVMTLGGGVIFSTAFIMCFLIPIYEMIWLEEVELIGILIMAVVWLIFVLPISFFSYKAFISEIFFSTYYPIRFNRKTGMVYIWQTGGNVQTVPWCDMRFVLYGEKGQCSKDWSLIGCLTEKDGNTITQIIPLSVELNWGKEFIDAYWEFIRCYMEEGDEYLPDLADTIPWCPPVDQQKEGWLFGLLYISTQVSRMGWSVHIPLIPLFLAVSLVRWLVMLTSKIPCWPADIMAACQVAEDDPVSKGPENNPPQLWRPMLAMQGKKRHARTFAKETSAMDRIIARLKNQYGLQERND
ncbi:hypothetical protein A9B99_07445 [Mangrovibacter phragmitis]|uniref:DUF6708 domain-containing protein n=1 Tax=Mangrovibacter phragmitis TaxID=1691903 RepID=A0A1B7L484_9ENTR|nr:DUF6708 domain-containing protein [Mangrovibacter phragmitis]OAT77133.1 hypothetical protein A9B99_07445 [Mangrovibacter phragmitis]